MLGLSPASLTGLTAARKERTVQFALPQIGAPMDAAAFKWRCRRFQAFAGPWTRYNPLDRNGRIRLMRAAEAFDRNTHAPREHGGLLKRTGLEVLRTLLFTFANVVSGRCDPSYGAIAEACGMARSTVALALKRLAACGLIVIRRRATRVRARFGVVLRQASNAYSFPAIVVESDSRAETTTKDSSKRTEALANPALQLALERLGAAVAAREGR